MKLVIFPRVDQARFTRIREVAEGMTVANCASIEAALEEIVEADAFFGKLTPELLARSTRLRWVQSPTASLEHYLFPELIEHPCLLSNMRGIFSDVIADHVMGFIIMAARNLHRYLRQQWNHHWEPIGGEGIRQSLASGPGEASAIDLSHRHLADSTVGVVGVGQIGAEVCRRAAAFGMRVIGIDPVCRSVLGVVADVWETHRLGELLEQSDFVVIAAPHTPETEKLFRREQFQRMKRDAWLINVGRGVIVDLHDLTVALQQGIIAGAALDVFEVEPLPMDHPLWGMENAILTPHVAAASPRVAERHLETLLENIRRFVRNEPPLTVVDKRRWF